MARAPRQPWSSVRLKLAVITGAVLAIILPWLGVSMPLYTLLMVALLILCATSMTRISILFGSSFMFVAIFLIFPYSLAINSWFDQQRLMVEVMKQEKFIAAQQERDKKEAKDAGSRKSLL